MGKENKVMLPTVSIYGPWLRVPPYRPWLEKRRKRLDDETTDRGSGVGGRRGDFRSQARKATAPTFNKGGHFGKDSDRVNEGRSFHGRYAAKEVFPNEMNDTLMTEDVNEANSGYGGGNRGMNEERIFSPRETAAYHARGNYEGPIKEDSGVNAKEKGNERTEFKSRHPESCQNEPRSSLNGQLWEENLVWNNSEKDSASIKTSGAQNQEKDLIGGLMSMQTNAINGSSQTNAINGSSQDNLPNIREDFVGTFNVIAKGSHELPGDINDKAERGRADVETADGSKLSQTKSPSGQGMNAPSISWKRRARNADKAHTVVVQQEPMGKRKPTVEGGKVWTEREGKRGKKQQAVNFSGETVGNKKAMENSNDGSGMAGSGSQPRRPE